MFILSFRFFNVDIVKADKFFEGFDQDDEGEIDYTEFVKVLWPHVNPGNEQAHWSLKKDEANYQSYEKAGTAPMQVYGKRDELEDIDLPNDLIRARVNITQRLELKYKNKKDAFRELDYNRDGSISREEMQLFFRVFGWEDVADRFYDLLDKEGTGEVCFRTFAKMFTCVKDSDGLVVVEFTTKWCGPCKTFAPKYKRMAEENPNIKFLKVNAHENESTQALATRFDLKAIPSFFLIRNGDVVAQRRGANEDKLRDEINLAMALR